jgi:hypothetical protein
VLPVEEYLQAMNSGYPTILMVARGDDSPFLESYGLLADFLWA